MFNFVSFYMIKDTIGTEFVKQPSQASIFIDHLTIGTFEKWSKLHT